MGKTIIPYKLNHKSQAHARVCKEIKKGLPVKVKGSILEACRRTVVLPIEANFTTKTLHSIKVIVQ